MKKILRFIFITIEVLFTIEFIGIPFGIWLNDKATELINLREYLYYNILSIIITVILGIRLNKIIHKQNGNKN